MAINPNKYLNKLNNVISTAKKNGSITQSSKAKAKQAQSESIARARASHQAKITSRNTKGYPTYSQNKAAQIVNKAARNTQNIINTAATTNARAAAQANKISQKAQQAQMAYNAQQAAQANAYNASMVRQQQEYNANQAAIANQFTADMYQQQMQYNSAEAEKQRAWEEQMSSTAYQRTMKDLKAAGLNPILAYTRGATSIGGGSSASIGSISGTAANSGLLSGNAATAGLYNGQMENTSNALAMFGATATAISSAIQAIADLKKNYPDAANNMMSTFEDKFDDWSESPERSNFYKHTLGAWRATWKAIHGKTWD